MPKIKIVQNLNNAYSITNAGGLIDLPLGNFYDYYTIDGSGIVLSNDLDITSSDTSLEGAVFEIRYYGNNLDINGQDLTIFGITLTAEQAKKNAIITAVFVGSGYKTTIHLSSEQSNIVSNTNLQDDSVSLSKIADDANLHTVTIPLSWESGEIGSNNTIRFNTKIEVVSYDLFVTKTIEATDNATAAVSIDGGSPANIVLTAGTTQNSFLTGTMSLTSSTNPSYLSALCTKTTVGGKGILSIIYKKIV